MDGVEATQNRSVPPSGKGDHFGADQFLEHSGQCSLDQVLESLSGTLGRNNARSTLADVVLESHNDGMTRTRLSTTVDADLLGAARELKSGINDAALIDAALKALLARNRAAEMDASYAVYDEHPLDEPDEWGDPASFRQAAAAS